MEASGGGGGGRWGDGGGGGGGEGGGEAMEWRAGGGDGGRWWQAEAAFPAAARCRRRRLIGSGQAGCVGSAEGFLRVREVRSAHDVGGLPSDVGKEPDRRLPWITRFQLTVVPEPRWMVPLRRLRRGPCIPLVVALAQARVLRGACGVGIPPVSQL